LWIPTFRKERGKMVHQATAAWGRFLAGGAEGALSADPPLALGQ